MFGPHDGWTRIHSSRMRFDQWRAVLGFERTNPLQLEGEELAARVALVYQQAGGQRR